MIELEITEEGKEKLRKQYTRTDKTRWNIVKCFLILLVLSLILATLSSCGGETTGKGIDGNSIKYETVLVDGHDYIFFKAGNGGGVVHSQNCFCLGDNNGN